MPTTIATAVPPSNRFKIVRPFREHFAKLLVIQAEEHLVFDQHRGVWRPAWRARSSYGSAMLPFTTDEDPIYSNLARNRDQLRSSVQGETRQVLHQNLLETYLAAHCGGTKLKQLPIGLVSLVHMHQIMAKRGMDRREDLKRSLEVIGYHNLHPRVIALTLIQDVEGSRRLVSKYPIVDDIVEHIARPYVGDERHYGVELHIHVRSPEVCEMNVVGGTGLGHEDCFVRFF